MLRCLHLSLNKYSNAKILTFSKKLEHAWFIKFLLRNAVNIKLRQSCASINCKRGATKHRNSIKWKEQTVCANENTTVRIPSFFLLRCTFCNSKRKPLSACYLPEGGQLRKAAAACLKRRRQSVKQWQSKKKLFAN